METSVDSEGIKTQTLAVKIPASAIPIRVNTITMDEEGITNESNGAYPVRVLYTVGLQDGVLDESGAVSDSVDSSIQMHPARHRRNRLMKMRLIILRRIILRVRRQKRLLLSGQAACCPAIRKYREDSCI